MKIFEEVKTLVKIEKSYTAQVLQKLMIIDRDKLYCELKYPSLFKYIVKGLGYSDAEAVIRVNAVRLMRKSKTAIKKIKKGEMTLTNAALANKCLNGEDNEKLIEKVVEKASETSSRGFKEFVMQEFDQVRRETLVFEEYVLEKFDRVRKKFGQDLSSLELILIMLERELKHPIISKITLGTTIEDVGRYVNRMAG